MYVCAYVRAYVRACVSAWVRAHVGARMPQMQAWKGVALKFIATAYTLLAAHKRTQLQVYKAMLGTTAGHLASC